ncbi:48_t:CDS:2, partial [Scutellospora calospora]
MDTRPKEEIGLLVSNVLASAHAENVRKNSKHNNRYGKLINTFEVQYVEWKNRKSIDDNLKNEKINRLPELRLGPPEGLTKKAYCCLWVERGCIVCKKPRSLYINLSEINIRPFHLPK